MKGIGKKGATSTMVVILLALIVVGIVGLGGMIYLKGGTTLAVSQATAATPQGSGCNVPLGSAQTPAFQTYNVDNQTAISPTTVNYTDAVAGTLALGANTIPGKGYTTLATSSGYARARVDYVTSCVETAPQITGTQKALDSSIGMTVYNQGGHTANSAAANQTLSAGSTASVSVEMIPSALRLHLGGATNQFAVFFNATNTTYWDTSLMSITGFANCKQYTGPSPSALGGVYVYGWICDGDFSGKDRSTYKLETTLGASANYAASGSVPTLCVVPVEIYQNSVTNALGAANSLQVGPVTNTGAAIDTPQCVAVYLK